MRFDTASEQAVPAISSSPSRDRQGAISRLLVAPPLLCITRFLILLALQRTIGRQLARGSERRPSGSDLFGCGYAALWGGRPRPRGTPRPALRPRKPAAAYGEGRRGCFPGRPVLQGVRSVIGTAPQR